MVATEQRQHGEGAALGWHDCAENGAHGSGAARDVQW